MRVIAGELRGRLLLAPRSSATRPITDRVKQSLFDILRPYADQPVYDCFAGTGSLGIEALSRGAPSAVFFEQDGSALELLKKNLATLGLASRCRIEAGDIFSRLASLSPPLLPQRPGRAFLDPPYRFLADRPGELAALAGSLGEHVAADGLIVFRHDADHALPLPGWQSAEVRDYGSMRLELLARSPK
jgi:16S rRNA (guanine966-N2)-methyltransferase